MKEGVKIVLDQNLKELKLSIMLESYPTQVRQAKESGLSYVGCWSHARRNFVEVIKAMGKGKSGKEGNAHLALDYIRKLYQVEAQAKEEGLSPEQIYCNRSDPSTLSHSSEK